MSSPLLSQTLSSDSTIVVPRKAVENALIMKSQFDTCATVLTITQEKVQLLEDKTGKQNQLILNLNDVIVNKDTLIKQKDNLVTLREDQIKILKKEKRKNFWNGVVIGTASGVLTTILLLLK